MAKWRRRRFRRPELPADELDTCGLPTIDPDGYVLELYFGAASSAEEATILRCSFLELGLLCEYAGGGRQELMTMDGAPAGAGAIGLRITKL